MTDEPTTPPAPPTGASLAPAQVPAVLSPEVNAAVQALAAAHADDIDDTEAQQALGKAVEADVKARKLSSAEVRALFSAYGVTKVAVPPDPDDKPAKPAAAEPEKPAKAETKPAERDIRHQR